MKARIEAGTMPPSYAQQLTADEKTRVLNYLNAGAPGSECGGGPPDFNNDPLPCNVTRQFKAHAPGSAGKYNVAASTRNVYACFVFRNPTYGTNEIITASRPHPDSPNVHHFILFGIPENGCGLFGSAACTDGAVIPSGCVWPQLRGRQLEGWAPGGNRTIFPADIGTRIDTPWVALQVHYNSPNGGTDASGVEYCTEPHNPATRPNIAEVVTLGTDDISIPAGAQNHLEENTCAELNTGTDPVYVIGTSPHMHELGTSFTTEVLRNGQPVKTLSNVPAWDFNKQYHYPINERYQLNRGDALRTRCRYSNPTSRTVPFGPNTEDEMCYDFMMVYPASASKNECGKGITFGG
jgi:hypothetical protein